MTESAVADPGFPVGGVDSQGGYVSKILYVKTKEFGPLGGACAGHDPSRSANGQWTSRNVEQTVILELTRWTFCSPILLNRRILLDDWKLSHTIQTMNDFFQIWCEMHSNQCRHTNTQIIHL